MKNSFFQLRNITKLENIKYATKLSFSDMEKEIHAFISSRLNYCNAISELVKFHCSQRSLRSQGQLLLEIPRSHLKTKGDRAFSLAAPKLWNGLPVSIRGIFQKARLTYLQPQTLLTRGMWFQKHVRE